MSLGAARLRVLSPLPGARGQNSASVGIRVEFGDFHALLTGDSETGLLTHWLTTGEIAPVQVVKAAHHGSVNGVTPGWVTTTHPGIVVISVGARNSYGHPSPRVVSQWEQAGARVYRTDRDGTITIIADRSGEFEVRRRIETGGGWVKPRGPFVTQDTTLVPSCRYCQPRPPRTPFSRRPSSTFGLFEALWPTT